MSKRTKVVATLSAVGMAAFVLTAFVFLIAGPAPYHGSMAATHNHAGMAPADSTADASEPNFYTEMANVNGRMHQNMAVAPTGNVDRVFMRMMIPHHQGAIAMAVVLLKYGHDERLRRLAQSIIVEQGQEIAYMRTLLDKPADEASASNHTADK